MLSFIYLGIYWNNHHHMMHVVHRVSGGVLWANLLLLFWLSLVPFVTGWMGENHFAPAPMALYGVVLLMAAVSYTLLVRATLKVEGPDSLLARAIGHGPQGEALDAPLRGGHRGVVHTPPGCPARCTSPWR